VVDYQPIKNTKQKTGATPLLKSALLGKVSFWLIVIGTFALITPQPAWPEWLARMILATGVALGITTLGVAIWNRRKSKE
jgi:hypothetical protein